MALAPKTVYTFPLDGSNRVFTINFEYLTRKFVKVTLIGATRKELVLNEDYRFVTRTSIQTNLQWGPGQGFDTIEVRRVTSATDRLVDFTDGSILRATDLNIANIQSLHISEEARDLTADTIGVNNDGNLDCRGRRIVNLGDAVEGGDAMTLRQYQADKGGVAEYAALSKKWAINPEDVPVADGGYSAYHWAQQAKKVALGITDIDLSPTIPHLRVKGAWVPGTYLQESAELRSWEFNKGNYLVGRSILSAPTIADVLLITPREHGERVAVLSAAGVIGEGGGFFWWNSQSVATPDGWMILERPGVATGRWERERRRTSDVRASWFGAVLDGVADDTAAVNRAVQYCKRKPKWTNLVIDGKALISGNGIVVDRLVDSTPSDWIVRGEGEEAGLYANTPTTFFTTTLSHPTVPQSEFVTLQDMALESSSIFVSVKVFSGMFLRTKAINCRFFILQYIVSDTYLQTHYILKCNVRNNYGYFLKGKGSYDCVYDDCVLENGYGIFDSRDEVIGTNGFRCVNSVIEGQQVSSVLATGCNGFVWAHNHVESNPANDLNLWAGSMRNHSVSVYGNYIFNPNGAFAYHGVTDIVVSYGNTFGPGILHDGVNRITNIVSMDAPVTVNGVTAKVTDVPLGHKFGGWSSNTGLAFGSTQPNGLPRGSIFMGDGAPSTAVGVTGDFAFRTEGAWSGQQSIYKKNSTGNWVAIA